MIKLVLIPVNAQEEETASPVQDCGKPDFLGIEHEQCFIQQGFDLAQLYGRARF